MRYNVPAGRRAAANVSRRLDGKPDAPSPRGRARPLSPADYRALAVFRSALRRFLRGSADRARTAGITAQQHQLLLAVKGNAGAQPPGIGELADALQVRAHTAVGLVDRVAARGLAKRVAVHGDRRRVGVVLTTHGERLLARLTSGNRCELVQLKRLLVRAAWLGAGH